MQTIRIARLRPDAMLPTRKHPADAGLDVYAVEAVLVAPRSFAIVPTGITIEIPDGYVGLLKPKGRNNHLLGAGVVDAGYQGEILVKVANLTDQPVVFEPGDAVGQLVILPVLTPAVEEVEQAVIHTQKTTRGGAGGIVSQHTAPRKFDQ
ncbi:MAG: dUTP diphosphatase [Chloroflexi bacterium]|nr:MAG: dUTP diphosphatase [Chloroflexota bacterium]